MALISANIQYNRGEHKLLDFSSLQEKYSVALAWAQNPYSNAAVGQFIYISNDETTEDGKTYVKGPYVVDVIGENAVLTPLSKGSAGNAEITDVVADIQTDVNTLKGEMDAVESDVADALSAIGTKGTDGADSTGLYKELDDIKTSIENIEVPVTDVKVDGASVVGTDGVAVINLEDSINTALADYKTADEIANIYLTQDTAAATYATKNDVYTSGQVDTKIEEAINALDPKDAVESGKYVSSISLSEGKLSVSKADLPQYSIKKGGDNEVTTYNLTIDGVNVGDTINIPKDLFVKSGSVVTLAEGEEGKSAGTYIKIVLTNDDELYILATDLVDVYNGSTYVSVENNTISVNYNALKSSIKADFDEVYEAKGVAKYLADGAKDAAIAAVNKTLESYSTTDATSTAITNAITENNKNYYTSSEVNDMVGGVNTEVEKNAAAIKVLSYLVTGGEAGDTSGITLIEQISEIKATVGDAESGLVKEVNDIKLNAASHIKSISINGVDASVSNQIATISLVNDLSVALDDNTKKLGVSAGAVNAVIADLKSDKASIKLVETAEISDPASNVIYLHKVDDVVTEKVYINGVSHVIGSDLYASKDVVTTTTDGLMLAADKVKLDNIGTITIEELDDIINPKTI